MTEEEIENQARERAEKLEESQTLGIYDNDEDLASDRAWNDGQVSGYEEGFKDGAKWGMETICKKILEEVKIKNLNLSFGNKINYFALEEIIKKLKE